MSKMHRSDATVDDAILRKKEQKDVELDKKIIALRKKNEALMRRYQEIEEDRKRAEQEGMAVTSRRARPDGLTITITKAHNEKRVVSEKWGNSPASGFVVGSEEEEDEEADHLFTFRMGKRVQLAVTMDNKSKGKRVVSEKRGPECLVSTGEAPDISEEEMDQLVAFRRGRRMQIAITMDKGRVDEKRTVERRWSEGDKHAECGIIRKERGKSPQKSPGDKGCMLTGRERSEYMRWKKERDQIDLERLARHKNARGEWRRAWDVEKSERMFEDNKDGEPILEGPHSKKGGRNARKSQHRSLPSEGKGGGQHRRSTSESASRTLPVMSSKARGKDRLTGRARRWDTKDGEEMSFGKEEPDNQRSISSEQLKYQTLPSEEIKEQHCLAGLDKNGKPQEHTVSVLQAKRSGAGVSAGEELQGRSEKARKSLTQEVSAVNTDETEAEPNLSKSVIESDLSPKGNCMNSSLCQEGNLLKQVSGDVLEEISSVVYEDGLEKNADPNGEDCAKNLSQLIVKAEIDGGGDQGLSSERQVGEIQSAGLNKQIVLAKESDDPTCLDDKERSESPGKEVPDKTNGSAQEGTRMRSKKQDLPQPCNQEAQN
ncbi:coiled-coil domain-containing protein 9B isoform X2 [Sceloporus undulatus]|uniref:coiled-coil domain-containing protein 9B isoform X2 n=1 Tax=Sceloporus undulatus TaxID=8520 RepID=UPI001C4CD629|nr:coiled-coil domain-containing protein 9B isoform X2 [Sceloporus undulatus]